MKTRRPTIALLITVIAAFLMPTASDARPAHRVRSHTVVVTAHHMRPVVYHSPRTRPVFVRPVAVRPFIFARPVLVRR